MGTIATDSPVSLILMQNNAFLFRFVDWSYLYYYFRDYPIARCATQSALNIIMPVIMSLTPSHATGYHYWVPFMFFSQYLHTHPRIIPSNKQCSLFQFSATPFKIVYYTVNTIIGTDIPLFTCTTCFSLKGHHQVQELLQSPFSFHLLCFPTLASVYTLGMCRTGVLSL
jgi:hypothetical protein